MKSGVFIIAEAGVNHNGSIDMAMGLIDAAATAGADAVKFQTFRAELLVSASAPKAEYQKAASGGEETQLQMLKKLELSDEAHVELMGHCRARGIAFLSTPFDVQGMDFLVSLGLDTIKVPSGEITNMPYLRHAGMLGRKIILSTGMSTLDEVRAALQILIAAGTPLDRITVLHANTEYPTPYEDANIRAMITMRDKLGVRVGYSDHTPGIEAPIAAVAMGAEVIEKHFTLDRNLSGPDHGASLEPAELSAMVMAIRNIEKALGDGVKRPSASESRNILIARKCIVASRDIEKGEPLTEDNLTAKRPATGISPMMWDDVIGRKAVRNFAKDEAIEH